MRSEQWTAHQLFDRIQRRKVVKPRMQRKLRWEVNSSDKKANFEDYVHFILKHRNTITPLLLAETRDKKYLVIDGNNRIHSIYYAYTKPLCILSCANHLPACVHCMLVKLSLAQLTEMTRLFVDATWPDESVGYQFCAHECACAGYTQRELESCFRNVRWLLKQHQIMLDSVTVPVITFSMEDEDVHSIYLELNRPGIKLTRQEVYAASTASITYRMASIPDDIIQHIRIYYKSMEKLEEIPGDDLDDTCNLFEVLLGLQQALHQHYYFIREQGQCDLDIVFKLYEVTHNDSFRGAEPLPQLLVWMTSVRSACNRLFCILSSVSDAQVEGKCSWHVKLGDDTLVVLLLSLMQGELHQDHIRQVIVYHELCTLHKKQKLRICGSPPQDPLGYKSGARKYVSQSKKLTDDPSRAPFETPPHFRKSMAALMRQLVDSQTCPFSDKDRPTRRKVLTHRLNILLFSMYYNRKVPVIIRDCPKQVDHIVPWAAKVWEGALDLNRLGNLMLIPTGANAAKSNKPITSEWLDKHEILYHNYPCAEEYNSIVHQEKILSAERFDKMCYRREQAFIDNALDVLFPDHTQHSM